MSKLTDDIKTVAGNVTNNRKNIFAQLESLKVQTDNAAATLAEMDSLRALLEAAMANAEVVSAAEARLVSNEAVINDEMAIAKVA